MASKDAKWMPGPGQHNPTASNLSHSFGFGTSQRAKMGAKKNDTPGPGYYSLPSNVGVLASYQKPAN